MKKILLTLEDLFNLPGAVIYNPDSYKSAASVSIDSRSIKKGAIFIAIKGENFDGHNFVTEAVKKGAAAVIINSSKNKKFIDLNLPVITVKNTTKTLGDLARTWRNKLDSKIIGLTGSAGKTTTKEILSALLSQRFKVNKTIGNNNNHIGVPLTIFSTNQSHDFLVLELGTNHFGEIAYTANIAQPDYALITNIGNSHLEFLKNKSGVLKEKAALFESTASRNGVMFINKDDALLKNKMNNYANRITFGFYNKADVKGEITGFENDGRTKIKIQFKNKRLEQIIPLYGIQNSQNYLAAAAVALKAGLNKSEIYNGTKNIKAVDKRLNVKKFNRFILINDTYNANPESMKLALELLNKINKFKKKIAVLGDMFELGDQGIELHKQLAAIIKRNKIDCVYLTGKLMKYLDEELTRISKNVKSPKINFHYFKNRKLLNKFLSSLNLDDSVILVKGSRGMKMEEFVKTIEAGTND